MYAGMTADEAYEVDALELAIRAEDELAELDEPPVSDDEDYLRSLFYGEDI